MKRVVSKSRAEIGDDTFMIRPGFLEDDDIDAVQHERKVVKGKGKKVLKVSCSSHKTAWFDLS